MGAFRQLSVNSVIYTVTAFVQKGTAFLLLPLYTAYLDPSAYGVLAIVTAVNGFLSIAFTLGLTAAVSRFYFEYRDDPDTLAEFWGTVLLFVILLSVLLATVLLVIGDKLLRPLIGDVPFWPYVAIGVLLTFFQPFFTSFLTVLQNRNQARRYAIVSLAYFALTVVLTIAFVVFLRWGVTGALSATLVATAVFFLISWYMIRKEVRFCMRWRHLRDALAYSLPHVPHSLASQTTAIADRMILNSRLGTAATGLYTVGAMIAMVVEVAAGSVNRAYVPLSMNALKNRNGTELGQMQALGSLVVGTFCLFGAGIGAFGPQIVQLMTAPAFADAAPVVPILVFGGVATAIYYLFVNALIFDRMAVRLLPVCTLAGALLNVALALFLIPGFGLIGAATANLLAQTLSAVVVGAIARKFDPVHWHYGRYAFAFMSGLACAVWLGQFEAANLVITAGLKLAGLLLLAIVLGFIIWRRPFILGDAMLRVLRRKPAEAASLFLSGSRAL